MRAKKRTFLIQKSNFYQKLEFHDYIENKNKLFLVVFGLTNRPIIIQNHENSRSKNRLVFGIDFGPLVLTFGLPKAPKSAPKCSQNGPRGVRRSGKIQSCDGPGLKMFQNAPRGSKSHHFGGQNDLPEFKKRSQNDPRAQNTTPK